MGFFSSAADPFGMFGDGDSGMDMMGLGGGSGGMPGMDMFGSLFGGGEGGGGGIFGSKPVVPGFKQVNVSKEQKQAIKDNLKSFGAAKKLSHKYNVFSFNELKSMLEKAIPEYNAMRKAGSARTMDLLTNPSFASMLRGEVPQDVADAIQNNAAAKSIGGGYSGSQLHGNLVARDLGLTSLDLIKRGAELTSDSLNAAERWMTSSKALSVPAQHNVASMFISPAERIAASQQNNTNQWTRDWLAAQVKAAPDPAARGAFDTAMGVTGMILSAYSGGPGYQNYYKSPYQGGTPSPYGGGAPPANTAGQPGSWQGTNNTWMPTNNTTYMDFNYTGGSDTDAITAASLAGRGGIF